MSGPFPSRAAPVVCVSRIFQRSVLVVSVAICLALIAGFGMGEFGLFGVHAGGDQDGAYRQMRVYAEVLKKVQTDYVTEPNINDVTTGALHGLLESLDSDSSYLTPTEYKIYKDRPTTGVAQAGINVSKRFGYAVSSPSPPARPPTMNTSPTATSSSPSASSPPANSPWPSFASCSTASLEPPSTSASSAPARPIRTS